MKALPSIGALALALAISPILLKAAPADRPLPEVVGFTCTPDPTVYTSANLFEIINGSADFSLQYGFVRMDLARYAGAKGIEVRLEVYEHDSVANAFGIYSQECDPAQRFLPLGTEAYRGDGFLHFYTGRYYVKTMTDQPGAAASAALEKVARAAHARLGQKDETPAELALLPVEDRLPHTEQLVARGFLGRAFFNGAWMAQFSTDAGPAQVFFVAAKGPAEAACLVDDYRQAVPGGIAVGPPTSGYSVIDPNLGPVELRTIGRHLVGVVNCASEKRRASFLAEVARRIAAAKPSAGTPAPRSPAAGP